MAAARTAAVAPDDVATIVYTSGTTGPPKGCMLTHANMLATIDRCRERLELDDEMVAYLFLPLSPGSRDRRAGRPGGPRAVPTTLGRIGSIALPRWASSASSALAKRSSLELRDRREGEDELAGRLGVERLAGSNQPASIVSDAVGLRAACGRGRGRGRTRRRSGARSPRA